MLKTLLKACSTSTLKGSSTQTSSYRIYS